MRLFFLVLACVVIGFFAVLVLDVSAGLIGHLRLGEVTVVQLWDKLVDRVLDRDLPQKPSIPTPPAAEHKARPLPHSTAQNDAIVHGPAARAPLRAAAPHEDAQHAAPRKDLQVENAKARLDDLLGHL